MLNTKKRPLIAAALLLTSLGITTSCIDNSYDLNKDIDMTVNIGGEHLAIPVGYTEKITLDKIIEIDEGDDLQVLENGEYHLLKSDNIDETNTSVKLVDINKSENNISPISIINENEFPTDVDYTAENVKSNGFIDATATEIDPAVIEIGSLTAMDDVNLTLKFKLDGALSYNKATIKTMEIAFPDFLQFKEQLTDNKYTITNKEIDKNNGLEVVLHVTGFTFSEQYGEGKKVDAGTLSLHEAVNVEATVNVTEIDLSKKASLSIKPQITLINPIFSFKANNPLNTNIELDGVMTGYKNGTVTKSVKIGSGNGGESIILKPSGQNEQTISLTRIATTIEGVTNVVVPNLNDIIETIPDKITVDLEPAVKSNDYYNVGLGQDYILNSSYDIDVPLSFGSNLRIVYEETIDDFDLDLEDVDIKKAILSINAVNTIPLAMEIKNENVSALDANGNVIEDIDVTVEGTITESKDGKTEVSSTLSINLNATAEGAISKLDGLKLKVTAVPGQATDVQLLSSQWMQLKDMKLKIPNGIKVDLN